MTQENLDNQRDVVKEEKRQRYDNVPYGNALIDVYATVFPDGHPYHHPTIGSMEDLDAASLEDVHAFFRHYYGPNNSVLTIVGDLDAGGRVRQGGDATSGRCRPRPSPHRATATISTRSPSRSGFERLEDVPNDRLHLALRLPVDNDEDYLACSLAFDVLGGLAPLGWCSGWSATSSRRPPSTRTTMGFVDGVSLGLLIIDVAAGTDVGRGGRRRRGAGAAHRRGSDRRRAGELAGRDRTLLAQLAGQPGGARRPDLPLHAAGRRQPLRQHAARPGRRHRRERIKRPPPPTSSPVRAPWCPTSSTSRRRRH